MDNKQCNVPILYIIFNRPEKTRRSFSEIRKARPTKLFITADGPRADRPTDTELCRQTREIVQNIDWPCEVKTFFRDKNVGTKIVGPTAIRWFFDNVDRGIILEDDGLPDQSFFTFCEELLEKYKNDRRIMHISGNNFQQKNKYYSVKEDYYFSRIPYIWGWATWKRAWDLFDNDLKLWPHVKAENILLKIFKDDAVVDRWAYQFDEGLKDTTDPRPQARLDWDGRWALTCFAYNAVAITPRVNLVSNIGFDADARTPRNPKDPLANVPIQPIGTPLQHPEKIYINTLADKYTLKYIFNINRYWNQRVRWFFKSRFSKPYFFLKKNYRALKGKK